MRALLRVLALSAVRARALLHASLAVALLSWMRVSEVHDADVTLFRALGVLVLGLVWGVAGAGVVLGRREAALLHSLPVRPSTAWLAAWIAGAVPSLLLAALIQLPELPITQSSDPYFVRSEWLASPGALAVWTVLLALASQGVGLLGRTLMVQGLASLGLAAVLAGATTFVTCAAQVRPVPILAMVTIATWAGSRIALGVGTPAPQRAWRAGVAALLAVSVAGGSVLVARLRARDFNVDEWRSYAWLAGLETRNGLRILAATRNARGESHLLVMDESGSRDVVAREAELLSRSGDRILVREWPWSLSGTGPEALVSIDLVSLERMHWNLEEPMHPMRNRSARISPDGRTLAVLDFSGTRPSEGGTLFVRDQGGASLLRRSVGGFAWVRLSREELLVGWRASAGGEGEGPPATRIARHDLRTGQLLDEREVPEVLAVSSDLVRLACLAWERDDGGWSPSIVVVERDGTERVAVPAVELSGWQHQRARTPLGKHWPGTRGEVAGIYQLLASSTPLWVAFDDTLSQAVWIRRSLSGRTMTHEIFVTDLATGESRLLLGANQLPASGLRDTSEPGNVILLDMTRDGKLLYLILDGITHVLDVESGRRSPRCSVESIAWLSSSGRTLAWTEELRTGWVVIHASRGDADGAPARVIDARAFAPFALAGDDHLVIARLDGALQLVELATRRRTLLLP